MSLTMSDVTNTCSFGWTDQEDMKIAQEEIFGPVMALMKFKYVAF
jgi:hypothetical protein